MLPVRFFRTDGNGSCGTSLAAWPRLTREIDHLFDWAFDGASGQGIRVDVRQEGDDLILVAEVPGLTREDIDITVEDNVLTISGRYEKAENKEGTTYHVRERRSGGFSRSFRLPKTADGDRVSASLSHGLLTLTVPTREEAKPRRIEVK